MLKKKVFKRIAIDSVTYTRIWERARRDSRPMSQYLRYLFTKIPKDQPYAIADD